MGYFSFHPLRNRILHLKYDFEDTFLESFQLPGSQLNRQDPKLEFIINFVPIACHNC